MREITIGDKKIRVRATPLALFFYKQEFKTDLIGDLMKMQNIGEDVSQIDSIIFLQLIWAMAKADTGFGKDFPGFATWLSELDSFDMSDSGLLNAVLEEAMDGFFRGAKQSD